VRALFPSYLRQQPEHNRTRRLVFFQIDQQLAELPGLRVAPERADPLDSVEVREA